MTVVHPSSIPALRGEMLGTTALTPTQHKSKTFKRVLGFAAAAAIPFVAPLISSAIASSLTLSNAMAVRGISAAVGAGLGAGGAALVGANPLAGAVGGAVIGGLNPGTPYSAPGGAPGGSAGLSTAGYTVDASLEGGVGAPAGGGADYLMDGGYRGEVPPGRPGTADSLRNAVDGGQNFFTPYDSSSFVPSTPPAVNRAVNSLTTVAPPAAQTGGGFWDKFLAGAGTAASKAGDQISSGVTNALTGAASNLIVQSIAEAGATGQELSGEQRAYLQKISDAEAQQQGLLEQKQKYATQLIQQAENVNPDQRGREALTAEQNRYARAQQAGLRTISQRDQGAYNSTVRRNALDRSRLGGYQPAYAAAEKYRTDLLTAGIQQLPDGLSGTTSARAGMLAADDRYKTQQDALLREQRNISDIVTPVVDEVFGVDSAAERKRKREEQGIAG